ncbi:MAG: class I SAM-dependent methyltransferase [Halofilum sp. (in: g-proteobacteria)]
MSDTRPSPEEPVTAPGAVPVEPYDWAHMELPDAWPDRATLRHPGTVLAVIRHILGKRGKVRLPEGTPGAERIPRYVLQEFHGLPNGNYSRRFTHGYLKGFERSMLGELDRARAAMARRLRDCGAVLDLGCGGGRTGAAARAHGVPEVWGVDPSPYLLQHAAIAWPDIRFLQGTLEEIPLPDQRVDGVMVNFVFHEIPPAYLRRGLAEIARVLRPGGVFVLAEPSPLQANRSTRWLVRRYGWRGLYFRTLVRMVHEPFIDAWHRFDVPEEAATHGFVTEEVVEGMPIKRWVLRRTG